ncbi:hypothetical protein Tco_0771015 [Tanacetum coccineum]|uniref:Uncharacterized protein n=1 Tax=Tanacetum coccineum TaxID=301880 RepID=A0ABQ4ZDU8_9ASTR
MAQPQRQANVHQDELCPPNKCYALMDANKKSDLDNPLLKFVLDRKEITMTLNDFRRIFQLPQATDNNHERFVAAPKFSEMALFFLNDLGFTLEFRSPSNFKTTDYAKLLWEGLYFALKHPSTLIPYPRFTKLIVGHYISAYPKISRRVRDRLDSGSYKENPEVEIIADVPVNVIEEEENSA